MADVIDVLPEREPVPAHTAPQAAAPVATAAAPQPQDPPKHEGGKTAAVVDELNRRAGAGSSGQATANGHDARRAESVSAGDVPKGSTPLSRGACHVINYREDPPKPKRSGEGTFVKAYIEMSDGRQLTCVYGKFRERLAKAHRDGGLLIIHDKKSDYSRDREVDKIDEIGTPQDRALPGLADEEYPL